MDYTNLETRFKNDASWMGAFVSTAGENRLKSAILSAGLKIWNERPFPWMMSSHSLATTSGTLGPYDPPSGFKGFPPKRVTNRFLWGDLQISYVIRNSDTQEFEIIFDESQDKFYFRNDPGDTTHTVYYIGSFDNDTANIVTTLAPFPEELFEVFVSLTMANLLNTKDSKKESQAYEAEGYAHLSKYYQNFNAIRSKPRQRSAKGFNGMSYDGIAEAAPLTRTVENSRNLY